MANWTNFYLIRIEFLGFRYHGWQKQANYKSVHGMVDKTFDFIFKHSDYRSFGCGRTDAKVSADDYALELFINQKLDTEHLLTELNSNLPSDIRAKSVMPVGSDFNVLKDAVSKEYHYFFSSGKRSHPFNAPFIRDFGEQLDMERMMDAARLFEGTHNFKRYVSKPSPAAVFEREIFSSQIVPSTKYSGRFSPENAFVFKVKSKGFMRYQVRLMMGVLVEVGRGTWTNDDLKQSLINFEGTQIKQVAPSSALVLHKVSYYQ